MSISRSNEINVQQQLRSDLIHPLADLTLCWACSPFYWYCHVLADRKMLKYYVVLTK